MGQSMPSSRSTASIDRGIRGYSCDTPLVATDDAHDFLIGAREPDLYLVEVVEAVAHRRPTVVWYSQYTLYIIVFTSPPRPPFEESQRLRCDSARKREERPESAARGRETVRPPTTTPKGSARTRTRSRPPAETGDQKDEHVRGVTRLDRKDRGPYPRARASLRL